MTVPFLPYGRQQVDEEDVAAVAAALRSDFLTTGPAVEAFEAAVSDVAGGHAAVAVNSGTAALHAAYAAVGVGPGTSIVTTPLTFASTATAALHLGASVRFADVDEGTLNLDPDAAAQAMADDTVAVVPVDYAGQPADLDAFRDLADDRGVAFVEDAAHSIGGTYRGRPIGDLADLTCFSFHPVKTVTTGEGGAVVVRDVDRLEAVRRFRTHGLVRDTAEQRMPDEGGWHQEIHALGLNYRLPDINAALGTSQLRRLAGFVARRAELVARYRDLLAAVEGLRLVDVIDEVAPGWHLFPVRILDGRRREVFDRLRAAGIGVQVHYIPAYWHPAIAELGYPRGLCPNAEAAYAELLSLPLFPAMTDADQDRVVQELTGILG